MTRLFLFFFLLCNSLYGHSIKPGYLEIVSVGEYTYKTKWKVPLKYITETSLAPLFPENCKISKVDHYQDNNILFITSTLQCKETLMGKSISIQNIEKETRSVIFHFSENNTSYFSEFNPTNPTLAIKNDTKSSQNRLNYISSGIKHILIGYDHLLFILGLLLLIYKFKTLIKTITAFTFAHSITLGASVLGFISISELFIEIIIALSIVILAVEVIYAKKGKHGLSSKYPWGVALFFGLIHGFGFANVLAELDLPKEHLLQSLLFFNIGIELGQILFIGLLAIFYYVLKFFMREKYLVQGKTLVAYSIGSVASFWFIERLSSVIPY
ncbi:MAG: HupE/UreJ family protein [Sulfurovum sp.]|nr:HupE/UreJ family protein [Sulfurovum sp.]